MTFVDNTCAALYSRANPRLSNRGIRAVALSCGKCVDTWRTLARHPQTLSSCISAKGSDKFWPGSCAARNWRCSTEQQQQPRCLQVLHCGDSLKQQLMFRRLQIRLIYDVERPTGKAILGQWQLKTTLPHHCARFHQARCSNELRNNGPLRPNPVPKLGLPVVLTTPLAKPSALPRLCVVNKQSCRCPPGARRACCPRLNKSGINGSPCSPPHSAISWTSPISSSRGSCRSDTATTDFARLCHSRIRVHL